jgi:hypothetical protein
MNTPKTDTPRTDAEADRHSTNGPHGIYWPETVSASLARTLERELAEAKREIEQLKAHLSGKDAT